jgi:hypothetical protein
MASVERRLVVQRNDLRNGPQPASETQRKVGDFDGLAIYEVCENRPETQLSAMLDLWLFGGIFLTPVRFAGLDSWGALRCTISVVREISERNGASHR